ncbi:GcrA family cell cycle regulator [Falsiroseomonas selenitidurans]|uniref:GcrA cell cycle regulator n=1 Tax=Falsiroseomonas selenitidurans TaxID=2716335 RepID=A0ABX1E2V7_9PROT|nr:GcrA family cell cycle regulator [Falsiroseomonas selenitidurans]NKC31421.1 GcrA cell cycle regulator [Falsiroseomonas selenitidurans]
MDWTAEAIERLRALWAEGHSTAEIGRRMGVSKNAVVGKAHRLNLPARPSPIRRETLAERPAQATTPRLPRAAGPAPRSTLAPAASGSTAPVAAASGVVRAFPRLSAMRSCCWPIGEPGTPEFRFCSAEAASGKPYCSQHAAVAYVKARDRREDAA